MFLSVSAHGPGTVRCWCSMGTDAPGGTPRSCAAAQGRSAPGRTTALTSRAFCCCRSSDWIKQITVRCVFAKLISSIRLGGRERRACVFLLPLPLRLLTCSWRPWGDEEHKPACRCPPWDGHLLSPATTPVLPHQEGAQDPLLSPMLGQRRDLAPVPLLMPAAAGKHPGKLLHQRLPFLILGTIKDSAHGGQPQFWFIGSS